MKGVTSVIDMCKDKLSTKKFALSMTEEASDIWYSIQELAVAVQRLQTDGPLGILTAALDQ